MSSMLLHQAFRDTASRLPDKLALVDRTLRVDYGELQRRVDALANALLDDGVAPGDRVVCLLENSIEFAVGTLATLALGAACVPVGPLVKTDKLAFILRDTRAVALLTHEQLSSSWRPALADAPWLRSLHVAAATPTAGDDARVRSWAAAGSDSRPLRPIGSADDLAFIVYTSGTTGVSKGVMLTHANASSAWTSITAWLGLRGDDVIGLALPAAFIYGLGNLMMSLLLGATVVLERSAAFPLRLAELLVRERVTVLPGVPMQFASLLGLQNLSRFDFSAVRLLTNAAAALPIGHIRRLKAAFPSASLVMMYGQTECIRASYLPPDEIELHQESVGRGVPNQTHWLIDEAGRRLPASSTGELVVSGPHVMAGYWERPVETAARLVPHLTSGEPALRTGDIFRSDADGYLFFVGRTDDIIKTRGETVAPREVENAIYLLDGVTGCAVIGVEDESLGQALKAFVTVQPGCALAAADVIKQCRTLLESYKVPKIVNFVEELPRTESGKIRHASLR